MKRVFLPVIYVGEWVLFLYVLLFVTVFNMMYFANLFLIDTSWEEPILLPFKSFLLFVLGIGIVSFIYIRYLVGNLFYKKFKEVIWGLLFGSNLVSCILWLGLSNTFNLANNDQILLIIALSVSAILTVQIFLKYKSQKNNLQQ
ncbi:hypothetical protein [Bacillus sp. AK128]